MLKKNKKRIFVTIGVICCFLGLYLVLYNYIETKINKAYNQMNLDILAFNENNQVGNSEQNVIESDLNNSSNIDSDENKEGTNISQNTNNNQSTNNNQNNQVKVDKYEKYYIGKLRIPKINLSQGFLSLNSKYNNVDINIQTIETSKTPDYKNSNLILASHSGNNAISYFKYLYKLKLGDKCYIDYKGKTYTYKIVDIYYEKKDGLLSIRRDYSKNVLTLITCTRNSETLQTIYIAELVAIK